MYKAEYKERVFTFRFPAGTSRGVLYEKKSCFIILRKDNKYGIGECSVIPGLSPDNMENYNLKLQELCDAINQGNDPALADLSGYPSMGFGLETALRDIETGGTRELFPSPFTKGLSGIAINGLIWMGNFDFQLQQVTEKIEEGFRCLKFKIGSVSFDEEVLFLKEFRKAHPDIEIRLDANGAFGPGDALEKLKRLSDFSVHSIEQPVMAGQPELMAEICQKSPIPVALDEELIGIDGMEAKRKLIKTLHPAYIILKPSLVGGLKPAAEWIEATTGTNTGWWVTSALESNIGLNAIAQWCFTLNSPMVQGLGTGHLYVDNIASPLEIYGAKLFYNPTTPWGVNELL